MLKPIGLLLFACLGTALAQPPAADTHLSHDVFFTLNDRSEAAKAKLIEACRKYLKGHPGEISFSAGTRAEEFVRDVNDQDFDVALHIVFRGKADHDRYQAHARHKQFIAENQANWKKVRVFDSYVK